MRFLLLLLLPVTAISQTSISLEHVNIIDVQKGIVLQNRQVLIVGSRIQRISSNPIPVKGATIVEARGKYLMPGLCDFNAQVLNYEQEGVPAFSLLLANGVTSVRDHEPDQSLETTLDIKQEIAAGRRLAPRLYLTGKTLVDRTPFQEENNRRSMVVTSAREAVQAVDLMLKNGADVIELRTVLNNDILMAITGRAHAKGVKVIARFSGSWEEGSNLGIDSYSHISDLWRTASKGREHYYAFSKADSMRFVSVTEFYNRVLPSFGAVDTPYFQKLLSVLRAGQRWLCFSAASFKPSLVRFEIGDSSRAAFRTQKQRSDQAQFSKQYDAFTFAQVKASKPALSFVITAAQNRIPIVAGTQLEDFITPGMSMHDMLYWLVDGGLSPADAIRSATLNPAVFLQKQKDLGTVEPGKLADLVLLEANPLEDISNTRKITAVIANGRLLQRKDLDRLLEDAKARVKR